MIKNVIATTDNLVTELPASVNQRDVFLGGKVFHVIVVSAD